jgi:hypothetical protein
VESTVAIFIELVNKPNCPLKYLLTYKLSQDHLELFFGAVRSRGCNNNPTVRQFTAAHKRLLMHHNVEGGLGNCSVQDTTILGVTLDSIPLNGLQQDTLDMSVARMYDLQPRVPLAKHFIPNVCTVVLTEVALNCFTCLDNHMFDSTPDNNHVFNLIKCISSCYCTIRMYHLAKQRTVQLTGPVIRKQLTKLVLFKHR